MPDADPPTLTSPALLPVPAGKVASVVTSLAMNAPPARAARPVAPDLALRRVADPTVAWYRDLYRRVGADWLWFSRLRMPERDLAAVLADPLVEIHALVHDGADQGLIELDRRQAPDIELAFFGLAPGMIGRGAGRFMMDRAVTLAWAHKPRRFWVHTCTLDHPEALAFYIRSGFTPFARAVEIADDPRLTGELPADAAPHVPIIAP